MEEFNAGAKNQDSNKAVFRKNYGIEVSVPGFYILDAKLYPTDLKYVMKAVWYELPDNNHLRIRKCESGQKTVDLDIKDAFPE